MSEKEILKIVRLKYESQSLQFSNRERFLKQRELKKLKERLKNGSR